MLATMRAAAPRIGSPTGSAAGGDRLGGGAAGAGRRRRGAARAADGRGAAAGHRLRGGVAPVVGEEVLPALAHRRGVGEVLLVHLVDEPRVRAERAGEQIVVGGVVSHGTERTGAGIHHSAVDGG